MFSDSQEPDCAGPTSEGPEAVPEGELPPDQPITSRRQLEEIKSERKIIVRDLLRLFGAQRRGSFIVDYIQKALDRYGLTTVPDFNSVWIGADVSLVPVPRADQSGSSLHAVSAQAVIQVAGAAAPSPVSPQLVTDGAIADPTYRIGKLDAANKSVVSVTPNHSLRSAVTQMLAKGYSQLAVMQGERDVKGIISWESIGSRFALDRGGAEVREFMTPAQVIESDRSLFEAIGIISQHQYVLVQNPDKRISGIVTGADLMQQFQQLTEPFLLLGEIEHHIRKLIVGKFTPEELKQACDPSDNGREIADVADLSMGEYIRLMEKPANWGKLSLGIDREVVTKELQDIRRIRNDVMHFDPDPFDHEDLKILRNFVAFMRTLRDLGFE